MGLWEVEQRSEKMLVLQAIFPHQERTVQALRCDKVSLKASQVLDAKQCLAAALGGLGGLSGIHS